MKAHLLSITLVIFYLLNTSELGAQQEKVKPFSQSSLEFAFGSSPTETNVGPLPGENHDFNENSVHAAFLINVSKYFHVGLQYNFIWTRLDHETFTNHFIAGPFGRYHRPLGKRFGLMGELSLDMGNYCPCIDEEGFDIPHKKEGIYYAGSTIGGSYKLIHLLSLYGSITYFKPLMKQPPESYDYFQPVIGLQVALE